LYSRPEQRRPELARSQGSNVTEPETVASIPGQFAFARVTTDVLHKSQLFRDGLFQDLKERTKEYTFDYVVITLPPGSVPGINVSVPVSHIRYSSTVFFDFDRYSLEPAAEAVVLDFARTLLKDKSFRSILVVGHTDSVGTEEYNYDLSKRRAAAVAVALRTAGIRDSFLGIVPMGKAQPLTTNSTAEGRALNRRVEFFVSDVPGAPKAAIERIKFNPCYRNDYQAAPAANPSECNTGPVRVPVLSSSGEGRPTGQIDLSRGALPAVPLGPREPLPTETLQRPSISELQNDDR
jgi:outer membrane protein OmpA-like peptidoglycan-associated protein